MEEPIRVSLEQEGDYAFRVRFHDTGLAPLLTDEPPPLGHGLGPNPARLLLAALANCLSASLLFALRKYHNTPGTLHAEIVAVPMRNAEGRWRIPKASVELTLAEGGEAHRQLERILAQFEQFCIVTQSVREGIEVDVTVKDVHGRVLLGDRSFEAGA
ncbi:OsmC family protein [Vulcaniibacterium gelatinicum]|uniref:OsmC family protein n=1 Tax=Vulcaniibacterium gelatinicum TaxID=2598725 RepID=UPI001FE68943|nr:OsmC family protein [Vulcaniibacterium gelatinicum]